MRGRLEDLQRRPRLRSVERLPALAVQQVIHRHAKAIGQVDRLAPRLRSVSVAHEVAVVLRDVL